MNIGVKKAAVVMGAAVILGGTAIGVVSAQGPVGPGGPGALAGASPFVCSTTNYDDVAAKALGIQGADLRKALVGGQSLQQIATSKNVSLQTVEGALITAREADLQQALTDGLITQQMYDNAKSAMDRAAGALSGSSSSSSSQPATPAAPPANAQGNNQPSTGRGGLFGFFGRVFGRGRNVGIGLGVPRANTVNSYAVASKALSMSCADMVKAMQGGQSIAQIATSKNVQAQTVIDALVAADKAAIAQNVSEGLVAQAQADSQTAQSTNRAGQFVYAVRRAPTAGTGPGFNFGFGQGGPGGLLPFFGGRGRVPRNDQQPQGQQGQQGGQPQGAQPQPQGTPSAASGQSS